ncbi:MAG: MerR family transcriptional regulator [bacterium]
MLGYKNMLSIGDVCRFLGLPTHTLRYWEKEFKDFLSPSRTGGKQRRYNDDDMIRIRRIKKLLKEDGYSIAGARKILTFQNQDGSRTVNTGISKDVADRIVDIMRSQFSVPAGTY